MVDPATSWLKHKLPRNGVFPVNGELYNKLPCKMMSQNTNIPYIGEPSEKLIQNVGSCGVWTILAYRTWVATTLRASERCDMGNVSSTLPV